MKKNNLKKTKENVTAKVKTFFAILAKMEWYSFILFGPSLVMLGVVVNCIYLLASGACPDMGRAVEGIVFVDKDDHLLASLLMGTLNKTLKSLVGFHLVGSALAIYRLIAGKFVA